MTEPALGSPDSDIRATWTALVSADLATARDRRRSVTPDDGKRRSGRAPGRKDRDRVYYAASFQRLSGVTQVLSPDLTTAVHSRLTHSLKVAQVARSIAEALLASIACDGGSSATTSQMRPSSSWRGRGCPRHISVRGDRKENPVAKLTKALIALGLEEARKKAGQDDHHHKAA